MHVIFCYFQGETSSKTVVQVTVDNKSGGSASTSSMKTNVAVTTVKGSVEKTSPNFNSSKILKKKTGDGSQGIDDEKTLMNCIKNCAYYESCVGEKEARFREIGREMSKLCDEREKLDVEQKELCEKIQAFEAKSPEFSLMEFRDFSFLKYTLSKKLKEKQDLNRQISLLRLESDRVTKAMREAANLYKSFVYKREQLLQKGMMRKVKK